MENVHVAQSYKAEPWATFSIQLLKPNVPPYDFSVPRKALAVRPAPIVKPSPRPASNDERECARGQLQLLSFSSQAE